MVTVKRENHYNKLGFQGRPERNNSNYLNSLNITFPKGAAISAFTGLIGAGAGYVFTTGNKLINEELKNLALKKLDQDIAIFSQSFENEFEKKPEDYIRDTEESLKALYKEKGVSVDETKLLETSLDDLFSKDIEKAKKALAEEYIKPNSESNKTIDEVTQGLGLPKTEDINNIVDKYSAQDSKELSKKLGFISAQDLDNLKTDSDSYHKILILAKRDLGYHQDLLSKPDKLDRLKISHEMKEKLEDALNKKLAMLKCFDNASSDPNVAKIIELDCKRVQVLNLNNMSEVNLAAKKFITGEKIDDSWARELKSGGLYDAAQESASSLKAEVQNYIDPAKIASRAKGQASVKWALISAGVVSAGISLYELLRPKKKDKPSLNIQTLNIQNPFS